MERNLNEYNISFVGLKEGIHEFEYKIGDKFFTNFTNATSVIGGGNVAVELVLEKSSTMLVLMFSVRGEINVNCDVCLDPLAIDIENDFKQICKFSDEEFTEHDDEIVGIPPSDHEVNVARFIYEFIHLCIPAKMVHEEGECNENVKSIVEQYILTEEPQQLLGGESEKNESVDPRWAALEALKNKN